MPSRRATLLSLLAALVLVVVTACSSGSDGARPSGRLVATGYALAGSATPSDVTRDGGYLRTIGIDGTTLAGPDSLTPVTQEADDLRRAAQAAGRDALLLVSNYSKAVADYDESLANQVLASAASRAPVVAAVVSAAQDFDGVQLDLVALTGRDSAGLVAFTRELRARLPASAQLSMAFTPSTDFGGYRERGYDLKALSPSLDRMVLMAYTQHGTRSGPGPIAPLPWVRRELTYFASQMPRSKVDLGVAAYGHEWGDGAPKTLTVPEARKVAGAAARWSAKDAEWTATLSGGRTVSWSDRRSLAAREQLAASLGVHGVAVWQVGASGPLR